MYSLRIAKSQRILAILFSGILLSSCGYNEIQRKDEAVKASWAQVLNVYQRRADLIPNLVKVVKAYAKHEKDVFVQVTNARSQIGGIKMTPEMLENPAAFAQFQKAQSSMSSALSRLMLVVENYPDLKANQNFRDLQAQLEGTENRIAVERRRYIQAVQDYNVTIRTFPNLITAQIFGYVAKPTFEPDNVEEVKKVPEVNFDE
ncbi:MAG: LemA family protein [Leptospiraceae bacterium]|nr:LemA family protein [Leptospiraceae bacterium]